MNIHLPQSIQARNELKRIANVKYQIVGVKDSSPIIGCQQDTLSGAYMLTEPSVKLMGWEVANILCNTTSDTKFDIDMNKTYTGHEIFSHIIPSGINNVNKNIEIRDGKLIKGYLDKSSLSFAKNSIIHFVWDKWGPDKTRRFIDDSQRLVLNYLLTRGQTVSFGDILLDKETNQKVQQIIENAILQSKYDITQFENDALEGGDNIPVDIIEGRISSDLAIIQSNVGMMLMQHFNINNFFWAAAKSGAKGNASNVSQINGVLGQNNVEGTRIKKKVEGRSLVYFHKDDDTPEARGFIKNSYLSGLKGFECCYNAMASREGLIDTAIKSVTRDTPLIIIENGQSKYVKIGDWIDNKLDNPDNKDKVENHQDRNLEIMDVDNIYIPTVDDKGKVTWGTVTAVTRHDPGNQLYEIKTYSGRKVTVTESQSLLIWNNETKEIREKLTPLVKIGDQVPITCILPQSPIITDDILLSDFDTIVDYVEDYCNRKSVPIDYKENEFCYYKLCFNSEEELNKFVMLMSISKKYFGNINIDKDNNIYELLMNNNKLETFNDVVLDKIIEINIIDTKDHPKVYDLTIPETFNFCIANGLGCRDTASTGYIQRQLIKGLEDLMINYDGTNRNARGIVVQMIYGENGINQSIQTDIQLNILEMDNKTLEDKLGFSKEQMKKLSKSLKLSEKSLDEFNEKYIKKMKKFRDEFRKIQFSSTLNYKVLEDKFMLPVNLFRITQFYSNKKEDSIELSPMDIEDEINKFLDDYDNRLITLLKPNDKFMKQDDRELKFLLEIALNEYLAPVKCIFEYNLSKKSFKDMMSEINASFIKAIIEPGEMVGILAAQSIGEPTSQMTLNTKHFAGASKKTSTTSGVARIQELFHYSKNIKTPQMIVYFQEPYDTNENALNRIVSNFKYLNIRQLYSSAEVYYDVGTNDSKKSNSRKLKNDKVSMPFFVNNQKVEINTLPFVFRIKINIEKMLEKETSLLDIKTKFISYWYKNYTNIKNLKKNDKDIISKISRCAILSNLPTDEEQILHIRFNMSSFNYNIITDFLKIILDDITLKGIENITNLDVVQERRISFNEKTGDIIDNKENVVYTSGINFDSLKMIKGIDFTRTRCNNIDTILKMYGIEATRQILLYELKTTYSEGGSNINVNHLSLLVDQMCHMGEITAMDRHGLAKIDIDPIARASFEKTMDHFINAAIFNEKDTLSSVSSRIALGKVIHGGTGAFELLLDTKKIKNSEYTENETGGRITFTPLEEELLLVDIVKTKEGSMAFFNPHL
jgi:DNA-directed RNA polymerase beta' subunit